MEDAGRNETDEQRSDRQLGELLQELRVAQTGVQVLFAFLLGVPFTQRFDVLDSTQRAVYFATLLLAGLAVVLLLGPTVWHRFVFSLRDKHHLVQVSHRFALSGILCVGFDVVGVVWLIASVLYDGAVVVVAPLVLAVIEVVLWVLLPLRRRRRDLARRPG